jgi:hypothetical protein
MHIEAPVKEEVFKEVTKQQSDKATKRPACRQAK